MEKQLTSTNKSIKTTPHHFMNNLFNIFGWHHGNNFNNMTPKIEVSETKSSIIVTAELPGVSENDIELEISSNGYLTISGERKHETSSNTKEGYFSEISYGSVSRTIPLPWDLDYAKANADYYNGVLTVNIPKTGQELNKNKKINVKTSKKRKTKKQN